MKIMKKDVSSRDISELAEALLNCGTVAGRHSRDKIVESLPEFVRKNIVRENDGKTDVASIIRQCMKFENGLMNLIATVRHFEGNTIWIKQVNKVLPRFFSEEEEDLPRLLSSKPPIWIDRDQYELLNEMAREEDTVSDGGDKTGKKNGV